MGGVGEPETASGTRGRLPMSADAARTHDETRGGQVFEVGRVIPNAPWFENPERGVRDNASYPQRLAPRQ
jgi:hypothetical protein